MKKILGIISIITGISIIGRLSMGFISDRVGGRLALSACFILLTLALVWLMFTRGIWGFYLFAVVYGLAWGGMVPLGTIVAAELFGLKFLGVVLGSVLLLGTIGGSLGAPLAGAIFDKTGNYSLGFLICIMLGVLAIVLGLILLRYKIRKGNVVAN